MRPKYLLAATTTLAGLLAASAGANAQTETREGSSRGSAPARGGGATPATGGTTRATNCPEGCVPAQPALSAAEQRRRAEAARARRDAREQAERDRQAELAAARSAAAEAQQRAQDRDARLEQLRQQQAQTARSLQTERAERERLEAELTERERLAELQRERRAIIARGGGPLNYRPLFTMAVEGGVGGFAGGTIDRVAYAGGAWGARLGVDFFDWLGVEARYFGQATALNPLVGGVGTTVTNGGSGTLRLTAPIPYVQPYGFFGVGGYHTAVNQSGQPTSSRQVVSASYVVIPLGVGLNVPIGRFFAVGVEGTYHAIATPSSFIGTIWESAQNWSGTALLRLRL